MKKSFKKAGAAVLSMAMLLSMGAVSMPVYAADPTPGQPGQVKVYLNNLPTGAKKQGQGDSTPQGSTNPQYYDYYEDDVFVNTATLKMYKVAEFNHPTRGSGWTWDPLFADIAESGVVYDFETLLDTTTVSNEEVFTAQSTDLQKLASYLERKIRAGGEGAAALKVDEKTVNLHTANDGTTLIPASTDLEKTANTIAYYLITTDTDEAGVLVQPVLVSLKNSANPTATNPVTVALKGSTIDMDKRIIEVSTPITTGTGNNAVTTEYAKEDAISTSGDTAVVAGTDVIEYEISAQLPKYDPNVTDANITTFVISDKMSSSMNLVDGSVNVYLSETDPQGTRDEGFENALVLLSAGDSQGGKDYTYTKTNSSEETFKVEISGSQMRGSATNSTHATTTIENKFVVVRFKATVNPENFNTHYDEYKETNDSAFTEDSVMNSSGTYYVSDYEAKKAIMEETYTSAQIAAVTAGDSSSINLTTLAETATAINAMFTSEELTNLSGTSWKDDLIARVKLLIARDKYNYSKNNANSNTATTTYGNEYATGGGVKHDSDTTRLYSTNIELTKLVEALKLEDENSDDAWVVDGTTTTSKVKGAIFKLTQNYTASEGGDLVIGYAISDANGKLVKLTSAQPTGLENEALAAVTKTWKEKVTVPATGTEGQTGYVAAHEEEITYTMYETTNTAWDLLKAGTYSLEEVYAPTGFKKWGSAQTFEIKAEKDKNEEYNGKFGAESNSEYFKKKGVSEKTTFSYVADTTNSKKDVLKADIYNIPADTLPATGGIGTVLFTAGGISIVLIAGALFVMYMKKRNAEDEE